MERIVYLQCSICTSFDHVTKDCASLDRCDNCFQITHSVDKCHLPPQIRCNNCLRANTSTEWCDCQNMSIFNKMQGLRLVGAGKDISPLIDVTIYSQKYVALVSTGEYKTYISSKVVQDYDDCQNVTHSGLFNMQNKRMAIELHISIHHRLIMHPCIIRVDKMPFDVILGMDFLIRYGFSLRIGKFIINNHSPLFSTDDEIQYWRKVTVVNGPQVQHEEAKIIELPSDLGNGQEDAENEDILDLHPTLGDLHYLK